MLQRQGHCMILQKKMPSMLPKKYKHSTKTIPFPKECHSHAIQHLYTFIKIKKNKKNLKSIPQNEQKFVFLICLIILLSNV